MSKKTVKKAEMAMTDANKFPLESCREKLARRWGIDAVALSGPCEGQPLASAICDQMQSRWESINDRFAGDKSKVLKLAEKLAESWSRDEDDTSECAKDLESLNFTKEAASGIANYLRAYHIEKAAESELAHLMEQIIKADEGKDEMEDLGGGDDDEEILDDADGDDNGFGGGDDDGDDDEDDHGFGGGDEDDHGLDLGDDTDDNSDDHGLNLDLGDDVGGLDSGELAPGSGGDTVTIELPIQVVEDLVSAIEGYEHDVTNLDSDDNMEIIDLGTDPSMDMGMGDEIVPGEPMGKPNGIGDDQFVESIEDELGGMGGGAPQMAGGNPMEQEHSCGGGLMADIGRPEAAGQPGARDPRDNMAPPGMKGAPHHGNGFASSEADLDKEAGMALKGGRLRRVGQKTLKIGPEMSINNTDQQAGGHDLGKAKEKTPEDPKAVQDNMKTDPKKEGRGGHMAGGDKIQDKSTMGREPAFDPHEISEDEVTGGQSSLQGPDESFPEGTPSVPSGSAPIGNESWDGGNVETKGTVIATIDTQGIKIEANGKAYRVKAKISKEDAPDIAQQIGELKFNGDAMAFAKAAQEIVRAKRDKKDGITYTDTSKLEGDNFTNDKKKAPDDGGAHVYYDKKAGKAVDRNDEGVTETDTSKLEDSKFTNDADKEAETDEEASKRSMASGKKSVRTASDSDSGDTKDKVVSKHGPSKKVEDPKALDNGNIHVDKGGFTAGGTEVSAGDGSVQGSEKKFDAHEVSDSEVSGGAKSLLGEDESLPEGTPQVPTSSENIQNEEFEGGNVSTKGTVIAEAEGQSQKSDKAKNDAKIREARLKSASVLAADMLAHGEITPEEFGDTLERFASFEVPAIQALALSMRKNREKVERRASKTIESQSVRVAGLGVPVVYDSAKEEKPLSQKLSELFSQNKLYDDQTWDENGRRRLP